MTAEPSGTPAPGRPSGDPAGHALGHAPAPAAGLPGGRVGAGVVLALAAAGAVLVGLDFLVERHARFEVEHWPGFYALFGAAACVVAAAVSLLLRRVVQRPEDHYDR